MPIIEKSIPPSEAHLQRVTIEVDRHTLQRCRWRRAADDGTDFAFALEAPLGHGACVGEMGGNRYLVSQTPEPVLCVRLPGDPSQAAIVGWMIGNLHQPVDVRDGVLLVAEDPAARRQLEKMGVPVEEAYEIFTPNPHSAALAHSHEPGGAYDHQHLFGGHSHAGFF
ncbi:hypothetical protein BH23VER1_BH23VER1_10590 [soil metagenome]